MHKFTHQQPTERKLESLFGKLWTVTFHCVPSLCLLSPVSSPWAVCFLCKLGCSHNRGKRLWWEAAERDRNDCVQVALFSGLSLSESFLSATISCLRKKQDTKLLRPSLSNSGGQVWSVSFLSLWQMRKTSLMKKSWWRFMVLGHGRLVSLLKSQSLLWGRTLWQEAGSRTKWLISCCPGRKGGRKERETEIHREIKTTTDWGPSPKHISLSEGYFIADPEPWTKYILTM